MFGAQPRNAHEAVVEIYDRSCGYSVLLGVNQGVEWSGEKKSWLAVGEELCELFSPSSAGRPLLLRLVGFIKQEQVYRCCSGFNKQGVETKTGRYDGHSSMTSQVSFFYIVDYYDRIKLKL